MNALTMLPDIFRKLVGPSGAEFTFTRERIDRQDRLAMEGSRIAADNAAQRAASWFGSLFGWDTG